MNKRVQSKNLKPGDIFLCRDKKTPGQIKINGQIYGNWEDAALYIGNSQLLFGSTSSLYPIENFFRSNDIWGVFRATPELTVAEQTRVLQVALDLAGLNVSWWESLINKAKRFMGISVPPKIGNGINESKELIASGYEAAGRKISSMVPWKVELYHIDNSAILVRVF